MILLEAELWWGRGGQGCHLKGCCAKENALVPAAWESRLVQAYKLQGVGQFPECPCQSARRWHRLPEGR